jgi:hypothetical protein
MNSTLVASERDGPEVKRVLLEHGADPGAHDNMN